MEQLLQLLTENRVLQHVQVKDWQEAVRTAGALLLKAGDIREAYIESSIQAAKELGAYFVVRPGVALSHARPGADVNRVGLSLVTMTPPVSFGHPHNDPVFLLFMFATLDNESHLDMLREIVELLCDDSMVNAIIRASDYAGLTNVLSQPSNR